LTFNCDLTTRDLFGLGDVVVRHSDECNFVCGSCARIRVLSPVTVFDRVHLETRSSFETLMVPNRTDTPTIVFARGASIVFNRPDIGEGWRERPYSNGSDEFLF